MKFREEERSRLESLVDINCPPGHTVLSESERLESLDIAQKSEFAILCIEFMFLLKYFQKLQNTRILSMN